MPNPVDKISFAPIPPRAIGDKRLTGSHFRVLAAIAMHDRLSMSRKAGQGCWASNKRLAELTNLNYSNLSTALIQLGEWGYLNREPHPLNKRTRIYRVIYDALPTGKQSLNDLPMGEQSEALPVGNPSEQIVCPEKSKSLKDQELESVEYIPLKREDILENHKTYSVETAPALRASDGLRRRHSINAGAFLAIIERELKAGAPLDAHTRTHLVRIAEEFCPDTSEHQRAYRLLEQYGGDE